MYSPVTGRFTSKDSWLGDYNRPLSLNRWNYVEGNPINYVDPTGLIKQGSEAVDADKIVKELRIYNVFVKVDWGDYTYWYNDPADTSKSGVQCGWNDGEWSLWELKELRKGVVDTSRAMGGLNAFIFNYGYVNVENRLPKDTGQQATAAAVSVAHLIVVNKNFNDKAGRWAIVHELGHVWDRNNNQRLSDGLVQFTMQFGQKWTIPVCDAGKKLPGCNNTGYVYYGVLAYGSSDGMNPEEDFANSFAAYIYPIDSQGKIQKYDVPEYRDYLYYTDYTTTLRWKYVDALIQTTNDYRYR
jgi:hypothetical protein